MSNFTNDTVVPTELEAAVLGFVWRDGPCTAYAVRQEFRHSPAPRWSGSAGAIYPLVQRLERRGWLTSTLGARGKRIQRDFSITPMGEHALARWLRAPIAGSDASMIHDPLRTKLLFLRTLPADTALSVIAGAVSALRHAHREARQACISQPIEHDHLAHFAAKNALLIAEARVKWIEGVESWFSGRPEAVDRPVSNGPPCL